MKDVTLYGYPWVIRSDVLPDAVNKTENVKVYYQASPKALDGTPLFPTTQRVSLTSPNGSAAMIATKHPLGWGTSTVYILGRLDMFDPNVVAAPLWLHADTPETRVPGYTEPDSEAHGGWGDPNRREKLQLGVFVNSVKPKVQLPDGKWVQKYPDYNFALGSFLYHRVSILQTPTRIEIVHAGWWTPNQVWKEYAKAVWDIPSPTNGFTKVSIWRLGDDMYPASASGPPKIVVAGFKFTPM